MGKYFFFLILQRMVGIEQPLENDKSRSKALKIVGGMPGNKHLSYGNSILSTSITVANIHCT